MRLLDTVDRLVSRPAVALVLSALVGAAFGYGAATLQSARQTSERREVLVHTLIEELAAVPDAVPAYQAEKAFYRDPIRIASPTLLLNGEVLSCSSCGGVVTALLHLQVAISKYNDFVQTTNVAQTTTPSAPIPDNIHASWYNTMQAMHANVVDAKRQVVQEIKKAELSP